MKFGAWMALGFLFLGKVGGAGEGDRQFIVPSDPTENTLPVAGDATYSIHNRLGNILVYRTEGNLLRIHTDGSRYAGEEMSVQVREPEPGKFTVEVVYPRLRIVPPEGDVRRNYPVSNPVRGVLIKNGQLALGGKTFVGANHATTVKSAEKVTINGWVGETNLSIGVPHRVRHLRMKSGVGDLISDDLGPEVPGEPRILLFETRLGSAEVRSSPASGGIFSTGVDSNPKKEGDRVYYMSSERRHNTLVVTADSCGEVILYSPAKLPDVFKYDTFRE